ncbi:hypothetical protein G6514_001690 [Epicoccum nigrum]|nr:hypothetical protein G6514_001690 [Epicoccum nigrum]
MKAASQLGVRLLWIDAVCITQDDPANKGKNIPNMDIIYGKAFATIVALSGDNADAGLPGVNPGSRNVQRIESLPITRGSSNLDYNPLSKDYEVVRLVRTPRPFYLALQMSNWNTRGWIMQERLLSRRCIYFSPEAVYFQCGQKTLVEGGVNEEFRTYIQSSPMNVEHVLQKADHDNPVSDLTHMYDLDAGPRLWKAFEVYVRMVREYTKREFSFKGDILNGFAGMFSVLDDEHFQGSIKSTTLNGLPGGIFIHALLWTPAARIPRRGARFPTQADITTGKPDPEFPSWSWAGWDGTVDYPLFQWVTNIEERPVALSQDIQVGGLKLFPDKYEEAAYLLQRQGNEISSRNVVQTQDESVVKCTQGSVATTLSEKVLAAGQNPGSQDATVTQNGSQTPESGKAATRSSKGKEKATEEDPQTGKLWQDPDSGKMWLWFTPPGHEENQTKDDPLPGNILQMKAPVVPLTSFKITPNKEYLTSPTNVHAKGTQSVRRILSSNGKHCGLYWEQGGYEWVRNEIYPKAEKKLIMVAVSSHGVCYRPRQGPSRVEGPVPLFDNVVFPQTGPGSELINVLVVDEDVGYSDAIGERCTAAIIHINAWEAAQPRVRDVRIA